MTAKPPAKTPGALPLATLQQLADWLATSPLEEIELEQPGLRLRLKKPGFGSPMAPTFVAPAPTTPAAAPTAPTGPTLTSPMVGTFYRSPTPDAPAFVKEGDTVAVGQVIGIIEAMKTMNQITAEHAGTVVKVLTANAQPVEYGQPLIQLA